ncbi:type IV pilin protein [Nocardioides sambongensis]|uniref:type IV pilin protein n=1 Tax=Nocardioides sambongensis TaxID=2589074 RepID=UPI00112A6845|nr:prepilin-type N-terminal cleavage/methylation domain-containing protein [Nocardioides sambongensis]
MSHQTESTTAEKDQGFTLIELLVVIVIVGILAAIAIPVFLNQREKAVDAGVESDVKQLATIEETIYTDKQAYSTATADIEAEGFEASDGNVILIATSSTGFCIKGSNPNGSKDGTASAFWYDSEGGGLSSGATKPTGGACGSLTPAAFS